MYVWRHNRCPVKSRAKQAWLLPFFQRFSAQYIKIYKNISGLTLKKEKMRSSLFTDDTITYLENIKISTEKLLG